MKKINRVADGDCAVSRDVRRLDAGRRLLTGEEVHQDETAPAISAPLPELAA